MTHRSPAAHRLRRHRVRLVSLAAVAAASAVVAGAASSTGAAAAARAPASASAPASPSAHTTLPTEVQLQGHGWGPGIGMGQWGAFGYAAVEHKPYHWILRHFYGGTTFATTKVANVRVGIIENAGTPLEVTSGSRFRLGGLRFSGGSTARAVFNTTKGSWRISSASSGSGCSAGGWTVVRSGVSDPLAVPASQQPTAPKSDLITICRSDGVAMTVRGIAEGVTSSGVPETVNILPIDEYVADVVPSESSSGWGLSGASGPQGQAWGFQELEVQAVAARTYELAYAQVGYGGYADICDSDYCQSYPGVANEAADSTLATNDTTGLYLTLHGSPAPTEFSASTGGYTTNESGNPFPAVVDAGDSVCIKSDYWTCNPDHLWTVQIEASTVRSAFPAIGKLVRVTVTKRNGLGSFGGRALAVSVKGTKSSVTVSGDDFAADVGLMSDWFRVMHPKASHSEPARRTAVSPDLSGSGPLPSAWTRLGTFRGDHRAPPGWVGPVPPG